MISGSLVNSASANSSYFFIATLLGTTCLLMIRADWLLRKYPIVRASGVSCCSRDFSLRCRLFLLRIQIALGRSWHTW